MRFLGNLLWIVLGGGIFIFLLYILGGLLLCLTIVGVPFGIQCFKLAHLGLVPFGKHIKDTRFASGCLGVLLNVLWILTVGLTLALTHLVFALLCAITIIGIPFAQQHLKLARLSLLPFGAQVVSG